MSRKGIRPPLNSPPEGSEWICKSTVVHGPVVVLRMRNSNTHFGCVTWMVDLQRKYTKVYFTMEFDLFLFRYHPNTEEAEGMYLLAAADADNDSATQWA